jgi:hypothetical protein
MSENSFDDWGENLMDADLRRRAEGLPCDSPAPAPKIFLPDEARAELPTPAAPPAQSSRLAVFVCLVALFLVAPVVFVAAYVFLRDRPRNELPAAELPARPRPPHEVIDRLDAILEKRK